MNFCPVCRQSARLGAPSKLVFSVHCVLCGAYSITIAAQTDLLGWLNGPRARLCLDIRAATDLQRSVVLDSDNLVAYVGT